MNDVWMWEDPILLKSVVADINYAGGGGWRVSISPYNFLYTKLKDTPKNFVGMVFRAKDPDGIDIYLKIINAVHRWEPNPKRGQLPFLEYLAVRYEVIGQNLLRAVELIEEHRQKIEGEFKDEANTDESN